MNEAESRSVYLAEGLGLDGHTRDWFIAVCTISHEELAETILRNYQREMLFGKDKNTASANSGP